MRLQKTTSNECMERWSYAAINKEYVIAMRGTHRRTMIHLIMLAGVPLVLNSACASRTGHSDESPAEVRVHFTKAQCAVLTRTYVLMLKALTPSPESRPVDGRQVCFTFQGTPIPEELVAGIRRDVGPEAGSSCEESDRARVTIDIVSIAGRPFGYWSISITVIDGDGRKSGYGADINLAAPYPGGGVHNSVSLCWPLGPNAPERALADRWYVEPWDRK